MSNIVTSKLVPDWKIVLKRSLTVWLSIFSVLLGVLEYQHDNITQFLTVLSPFLPKGVAGMLSLIGMGAVPFARIYKQAKMEIAREIEEAKRLEEQQEAERQAKLIRS